MVRRRWILPALLSAALAGCGGNEGSRAEETPPAADAFVTVRTEPARLGPFSAAIDGLGKVEAIPDQLATLTPAVEGHVHALLVRQGDAVKRGDPIVELDKAVAEADLAEKTASRDALRASLVLLQSLPRPEERLSHELAVEQARIAVERAKATLDNLESLRGSNLASKQQLFDARKALEAAQLAERSAEAALRAFIIGPRPEAVAEAEARIKTAEGLVAFSQAHLDFHTIRSPIDGVLDSLTCHPGQTLSIGTPIGEVVNSTRVYASVWLAPRLARGVRVGLSASVRPADGHASEPNAESLPGVVDFVGQVADPQTGNLPVRILVENPDGALALGQTIQVSIDRGETSVALQVPVEALLDLGEGPVIEVVRDGKAVVLRPTVGAARGGWATVSGTDLREGEPVIVDGGYSLPEGTPVKLAANSTASPTAAVEARR